MAQVVASEWNDHGGIPTRSTNFFNAASIT